MKRARGLIERLEASRRTLHEQVGQARRQIERMQLELGELRMIAERMRRKAAQSVSPADTLDGPDSILPAATMPPAVAPASPGGAFTPVVRRSPPSAPATPADATAADESDATGFADTQFEEPQPGQLGFEPTQLDKPRGSPFSR